MIKIKKSEDCCGCSACLSICNHNAIVFKEDVEGFKYPMIEEGKHLEFHSGHILTP